MLTIAATTDMAATVTWEILQAFYSALPHLDAKVESTTFNLATESYGGHYGPAFFNYFYDQNQAIINGTQQGKSFDFNSLMIINGIIDEAIQAPYYPEMANHNTYGIKAVNDTVYDYMKFACFMENGCLDQVGYCQQSNRSTSWGQAWCSEASNMCRDNVEGPYYEYSGRGTYDIRHPSDDPTPPSYFEAYLNTSSVQNAIGVDTNYTDDSNVDVSTHFAQTGL